MINEQFSRRHFAKLTATVLATALSYPSTMHAQEPSVTIGGLPEDVNLDPNVITATDWIGVLLNIYQTLVYRGEHGETVAGLATTWRQIDPLTWEFTTQDNVKFHDGKQFGPEDVEFTIKRIIEGNLRQRTYLKAVETAFVTGPNTVQVRLLYPEPLFLKFLTLVPMVATTTTKTSLVRQTNGTGPYKLDKWNPGDQLTIQYATNYWGPKPAIRRAVYRSIPDANSLIAALQANEIDIAVGLQPDVSAKLGNAGSFEIKTIDTDRTIFIAIDNTFKPFDDARVRRALNLSIDRDALTGAILLGNGTPIANLCGPNYLGYNSALKPEYNPKRAVELLAEAGYPNGFEFTLNVPSGRYMKDREIGEALVGQWLQVGVKANLVLMEFGTYSTRSRNHLLSPAYLVGISLPLLDGAQFLQTALATNSSGNNFTDPQLVANVAAAAKIADDTGRGAAIEKLNAEVFEMDAYVYLYLQKAIFGISKRIEWSPASNEQIRIASIKLASQK